MSISLKAIAWVRCSRSDVKDDQWLRESTTIDFDSMQFDESALLGLADFSHIEVIYFFDKAREPSGETMRHPRGDVTLPKVGVFAQRHKDRVNRLGLSRCRILSVSGLSLAVEGLDAINGTPVIDVKPWFKDFGPRGEVKEPPWVAKITRDYF